MLLPIHRRSLLLSLSLLGILAAGCVPPRIVNRFQERSAMRGSSVVMAGEPGTPVRGARKSDVAQVAHEEPLQSTASPAVSGKRLGILPGSTAAERAMELVGQLEAANAAYQELQAQLDDQQLTIDQKNRKLAEAVREVRAAREELLQVKERLAVWQRELKDLREKIRTSEAENLSNMQAILTLLQQLIEMGPDDGRGGAAIKPPAPMPPPPPLQP